MLSGSEGLPRTIRVDILDGRKALTGGGNAVTGVIACALPQDATWLNRTDVVVNNGVGRAFDFVDVNAEDTVRNFFGT